jgi:FAD dependent oxidoreductase TIGR03364
LKDDRFDVIVVGAGIVGLAHALVAAERGLSVAVVERDARCIGASIRNFGFVTVTGQRAGDTWRRARRARDIWARVADEARIPVLHRGLWLLARRPEAADVLRAFAATEMGAACTLLDAEAAPEPLRREGAQAVLYSPHELRIESRQAIPRLADWLEETQGVRFFFGQAALEAAAPRLRTATRTLHAERIVLCPGTALHGVAGAALAPHALQLTQLQMLRVRPPHGFELPAAVMSDLSLVRYRGYADLPESAALLARLRAEEPECLTHGIHLIVVQSADGTLVVGDSHHDHAAPAPFASEAVDSLILAKLRETLRLPALDVVERWTGVYPTGHSADCLIEAPDAATRVVVVTSGTGASTAFGIAEDVFNAW